MATLIRPARFVDLDLLVEISQSLASHGFLTLPEDRKGVAALLQMSEASFGGKLAHWDEGQYLFVLEDLGARRVVGSSLIIARHGTPQSPHLYFRVLEIGEKQQAIQFEADTEGWTELGGLYLAPAYRNRPVRLGKALSFIRFLYMKRNEGRFCRRVLAELLPPLPREGDPPFWSSLGKRLTGLSYREADRRSRRDKKFFLSAFPRGPIAIASLSQEARAALRRVGPETEPVVRMLTAVGFKDLGQIDPFDGGPHYGASWEEIRFDLVEEFFLNQEEEREIRWMFTPS